MTSHGKIACLLLALCGVLALNLYGAKRQTFAPSYAWKLLPPLGVREPATIDTLFENYSMRFVPQLGSRAWAATGNYCAEGRNMVFMERKPMSDFYFQDAIERWLPSLDKMRFYNTRIPMTLLSYNFGGGQQNGQDALNMVFSGNVNSKLQIGALLDYLYSKGSYQNQAAKDFNWGFSGSYISNRYEFQGFMYHYNLLNKENGGITDPLYITDPAEVQGGNNSVNPLDIPTNLTKAHNRVKGTQIYLNNRYKLGFYKEEQVSDTTVKRTLVPVTSFIWTLDYRDNKSIFRNYDASQNLSFWPDTYLNPNFTRDYRTFWSLKNTLGVALLEGFNKWAKAGLSLFATYELRHYGFKSFTDEAVGEGVAEQMKGIPFPEMIRSQRQSLLWVGAQITKQQGRIINYDATGEIGLVGPAAGEIKIDGNIYTHLPLLGDTVDVTAFGRFTNLAAPWLMQHMWSNHFMWNNDFSKTSAFRIGGALSIPWTNTTLSIAAENIQNHIYFNENALPAQCGSSVQIFSATLQQDVHFKAFHWENKVTYQTSSRQEVIPMPKLALNSNMYLRFRIATLHVQLGVDCDYFTSYKGVDYQPATMVFYNQRKVDIGNYPFLCAYANFKLSKVRFYVMMSHLNQGWTGTNYFSMPLYPMNPRRFQLGLSIDFAN